MKSLNTTAEITDLNARLTAVEASISSLRVVHEGTLHWTKIFLHIFVATLAFLFCSGVYVNFEPIASSYFDTTHSTGAQVALNSTAASTTMAAVDNNTAKEDTLDICKTGPYAKIEKCKDVLIIYDTIARLSGEKSQATDMLDCLLRGKELRLRLSSFLYSDYHYGPQLSASSSTLHL